MKIEPDISEFPEVAQDLAHLIGEDKALLFLRKFKGQRFYIPSSRRGMNLANFASTAVVIGKKNTEKIYSFYAGTTLEVPTCRSAFNASRNRQSRQHFDAGKSISQLIAISRLSKRSIFYILKEAP